MKVAQKVTVTVVEVDLPRNRIALSMKSKPDFEKKERKPGQQAPQQGGGGGPRNFDRDRAPAKAGGGMGNPFGGDWFSQGQGKAKR